MTEEINVSTEMAARLEMIKRRGQLSHSADLPTPAALHMLWLIGAVDATPKRELGRAVKVYTLTALGEDIHRVSLTIPTLAGVKFSSFTYNPKPTVADEEAAQFEADELQAAAERELATPDWLRELPEKIEFPLDAIKAQGVDLREDLHVGKFQDSWDDFDNLPPAPKAGDAKKK